MEEGFSQSEGGRGGRGGCWEDDEERKKCVWRRWGVLVVGVLGDVHCRIPGKPGTNRPISLWLPTYGSLNPLLRRAPLLSVFPSFLKKEIPSLLTLSLLWKEVHS